MQKYKENADIPLLVTSDFENGCGSMLMGLTTFPYMISLGATNNERIAYDYGKATAMEAKSVVANWSFSPVCDLNIALFIDEDHKTTKSISETKAFIVSIADNALIFDQFQSGYYVTGEKSRLYNMCYVFYSI